MLITLDKISIESKHTNINIRKNGKKSTLYSYHELKLATRDFPLDNKVGEGNFGVVYKVSHYFHTMYTQSSTYNLMLEFKSFK